MQGAEPSSLQYPPYKQILPVVVTGEATGDEDGEITDTIGELDGLGTGRITGGALGEDTGGTTGAFVGGITTATGALEGEATGFPPPPYPVGVRQDGGAIGTQVRLEEEQVNDPLQQVLQLEQSW
jgi:hypothetical protein